MPKVIKSGLLSPEIGFPLQPPVGLRVQCPLCRAVLETEEKETYAEVCVTHFKKENMRLPGWRIKCPECGKKITIGSEVTPKVFQVLNANVDELLKNTK